MLNKLDLAKKFELVVQQEIKNYQDSLDFVLGSINEIKESIFKLRQDLVDRCAKIHSEQRSLKSELDKVKGDLDSISKKLHSSFSDQINVNERNAIEMRDITSAFIGKISVDNNIKSKIDDLTIEIKRIKFEDERKIQLINNNIDDCFKRASKEIFKVKKEIIEAPTEASIVRVQLEEKIASHSVDVAGIMKELQIFKRENYITQKKLENIYMLIERLKKS